MNECPECAWWRRQRDDALAREKAARVGMGEARHEAAQLRLEVKVLLQALRECRETDDREVVIATADAALSGGSNE